MAYYGGIDLNVVPELCASLARLFNYSTFAIENYGNCRTHADAAEIFIKNPISSNCFAGIGRKGNIFVYSYPGKYIKKLKFYNYLKII